MSTREPGGLERLADESFCYLTTTGRITGKAHTIEIWFTLNDGAVYMLSGGGDRSDWVRNLMKTPEVRLRIGDLEFEGRARIVSEPGEDRTARDLLVAKYISRYSGDLSGWRQRSVPIAIDLVGEI
jgi:deazaflavin-dependent oxidoreductase (nitroreductase family)